MEIISLPEEDRRFAEALREGWRIRSQGEGERAPGLHISDVVNDLAVVAGKLQPTSPIDAEATYRISMGFVWEDMVGDYLASLHNDPSSRYRILQHKVILDGLHGTIDALNLQAWEVEEYKATWRGEEKAISGGWRWYAQIQAYCLAVNTCVAKLRVLHLNPFPRPRTYRLEFSDRELAENWYMIRQHANYMLKVKK